MATETEECADPSLVLAAGLALGWHCGKTLAAVERLAAGEKLAVHGGDGADAQGVALAAPYGHPLVERGALGGLQFGGAEAVGDLTGHVEGDRQLRDGRALLAGGVVGQEVGDGGTDGAATDTVVTGEGRDGAAFQVRGAYIGGLGGRHGGAAPALRALGLGGAQPVVGQLALEVALEFACGGEGLMTLFEIGHSLLRGDPTSTRDSPVWSELNSVGQRAGLFVGR